MAAPAWSSRAHGSPPRPRATGSPAGLVAEGSVDPVSNEAVIKAFTANLKNLVTIIEKMVPQIPGPDEDCTCFHALDGASIG